MMAKSYVIVRELIHWNCALQTVVQCSCTINLITYLMCYMCFDKANNRMP